MEDNQDSLRKTLEGNLDRVEANAKQVGGHHYKTGGEQHWDRVHRLGMNWYAANVTKYVERYRQKNGLEDLKKARHYLDKLIEVETAEYKTGPLTPLGYGAVMGVDRAAQLTENWKAERTAPRHPYDGREAEGSIAD